MVYTTYMNLQHFEIDIHASKERVWDVLWNDKTLKLWAGIVDPGTHMVGELSEGHTVEFISGGGYGVTSLVVKLVPNEYVLMHHSQDTQDGGKNNRGDQWTGGKESYTVTENDGLTTLLLNLDVPDELDGVMSSVYPKALDKIKELSETP